MSEAAAEIVLKTSLKGKVRNLPGFKSEALLPVFEAIVNAIQAIEERGNLSAGVVRVSVRRDLSQVDLDFEDEGLPSIIGFDIEDNGIGFNERNFESFQTSDSEYKIEKGGKGVGRFLWLKAFSSVEIESKFISLSEERILRNIRFDVVHGVRHQEKASNFESTGTIVSLIGFKDEYRRLPTAYKTTSKIAQRIFEHCLARFISGLAPEIEVVDDFGAEKISLRSMFEAVRKDVSTESFGIRGIPFSIHHIRLYETRAQAHQVVYCASGRDVKRRAIGPFLGSSIQFDDDGRKFFYAVYVTSPLLDERVDQFRQEFSIRQHRDILSGDEVVMDEIEEQVVSSSRIYLKQIIESVEAQKADKISKYIQEDGPMLRAVLKYCPEAVREIELNTPDEKISQILYKYKGKAEYEVKSKGERLLKTQSKSIDEIEEQYREIASKIDDFQKDQIAGYLVFRKMIIDLLEKKLSLNMNGKFSNEDIVHDIIFPRKADSESIRYEDHNLWLIDETLAFHSLALSDRRLCDFSVSPSKGRPDVSVFAEVNDDRVARSVCLIEFKRPQRDRYEESPTAQLFRYVREIRDAGEIFQPNGRPVRVDGSTRIYLYAICDITEKIREYAEDNNFSELQGDYGFYTYNKKHNAHIEIVAFDKIVVDAKKRHRAFFDYLGIVK